MTMWICSYVAMFVAIIARKAMMYDLPMPVGNCQRKRSCFDAAAAMAQRAIACYKLVGVICETVKE